MPCIVFVLKEMLPNYHKWRYNSHGVREKIGKDIGGGGEGAGGDKKDHLSSHRRCVNSYSFFIIPFLAAIWDLICMSMSIARCCDLSENTRN